MFFRFASETSSSLMSSIPTASASFTHTTLHLKATLLKCSLSTRPLPVPHGAAALFTGNRCTSICSKPRLSPEILFDETLLFFQLFNPNSLGCTG